MRDYSDFALHQICCDYKQLRKYALLEQDIQASAKLQKLQGVCVFVCVCARVFICMHTHTHTHTHVFVCV
jgi:hypothetical protein